MSRIGKKPVQVPGGVTVTVAGSRLSVKGPKGELVHAMPAPVTARVDGASVRVECAGETKKQKSLHGLTRSIVANMVTGVAQGYSKELELQGVGFRAQVQGPKLVLALGYSHPVEFVAPAGIAFVVKENRITVSGPDRQLVGDTAARIRASYPPEPYKGKGVRYKDEHVRRKAGKTVA